MGHLSLGTRLAVIIILGSLAIVGSVIYAAYGALLEDFEKNLAAQQANETAHISSLVSQNLELRTSALAQFAAMLGHSGQLPPQEPLTKLLQKQQKLRELFPHSLTILSPNAILLAENTYVPGRVGTYYADRPHWKAAIKTRRPVISRPIIGRATGIPLMVFIAPILTDSGELLGFLSGTLQMDQALLIPKHVREDAIKDAIFLVIDTANFLFVEGSRNKTIEYLPDPGENLLIDAALSGIPFGEVETASGETLIYATNHLQRLGWLFIRAVPKSLATAPAEQAFVRFFTISIGVTLGIVLLTYLALRSTTVSLTQMTRRIRSMIQKPESSRRLIERGAPEVRDLAQAFNQLMDERDANNQLKDNFVSNVSHELRTPLTSMNGALRLLKSGTAGELPERAQEMTTLALRNGERLQLLINDLLDFNKLSSGNMRVSFQTENLQKLLTETVSGNEAMARELGVRLKASDIPAISLQTDGHRLRQILDNFVSNAIKHSPQQGLVTLHAEEVDPYRLRITVSDQGKGVPEEFRSQIFERFAQAETGTTRATNGTGLGLAISRQLAVLLGGNTGFYNNNGAHFWVELPMGDVSSPEEHAHESA
ncbi:ATP-binding protein [Marinobacter sp. 2_MG-2023]|uniref:sensor histidine kinase n=1 Tax=Marinobacter sp. 2_MG-2023 TaxID=3062679 RepID=UPI0026E39423|nr:ATP-binding protein [Marinobacter sp. 2_MG-2023]MDO6441541.1 ATP-binding protein [Marinobacter sp. 2_MG-2023]